MCSSKSPCQSDTGIFFFGVSIRRAEYRERAGSIKSESRKTLPYHDLQSGLGTKERGLSSAIRRGMTEVFTMTKKTDTTSSNEPSGIIISLGSRSEPTPVFSTYVWGPAPEPAADASKAA